MRAVNVRVWKQRLLGVEGGHGGNEVGGGDGYFQLVTKLSS